MLRQLAAATMLGLATPAVAQAQQADQDAAQGVIHPDARPEVAAPAAFFTGEVRVRPIVDPQAPGRTSFATVTFPPGARSHWHTHPAGQVLHVIAGCGWTQREGGPVVRICAGDTVYAPPGVKHWHGATATTPMSHFAITEALDGANVTWMEPVSDAQYREGSAP